MEEKIRMIADLVDSGEKVWFHVHTHEVLSHPDPGHHSFSSEWDYLVEDVMDQVFLDYDNYIEIPPPDPSTSYRIMAEFADTVSDVRFRARLLDALGGKKPFRFFRNAVEESPFREEWFDFLDARMQEYVLARMEEALEKEQDA